ncbi:diguanylate cyclase (GGDEF) domain-containing protein [Oscillospiraceae bacterium]|nr:diguanylate cyclase (GGDEF) domain-containing protein [Oscillospiraceae bacterium]
MGRCDKKEKRFKIAVFTSNIYESMTSEIQKGINKAALDTGCKVIYFCSFSDNFSSRVYNQYTKYDEGDTVCFDVPDLTDFDAVIRIDSSYSPYVKEKINEILEGLSIPVINVGGKLDGYLNVLGDDNASFGMLVDHLIKEHGCRELFQVAGKPDKYFTPARIGAMRKAMEENGLTFDPDKIYYGNLWRDCGEDALDAILKAYEGTDRRLPDAIVCANDFMAIGVAAACRRRGIEIPGDVLLTGFDGVDAASQGFPSITTSKQPFFKMGYQSILTLLDIFAGKKFDEDVKIIGDIQLNQSCGCASLGSNSIEDIRNVYLTKNSKIVYLAQSTTNMILSTSNSRSIDECFREIARNASVDTGFKAMYLCLVPEWDKQFRVGRDYSASDCEMTVVAGFDGEDNVPLQTFRKKDLLPRKLLEDDDPCYIFAVHHLQYYMGYMIVKPETEWLDQLAMKSWIVNVASMIEFWRIRRELSVTVNRLENLYNRDMLTGLYNRRGYEMFFEEYYNECKENGSALSVMVIDMDDLKNVNDHYGHAEGDYAICTIAEALKASANNSEICMRAGGDEFVVLAKNYSETKAERYKSAFREYIGKKTESDRKEFAVNVSCGVFMDIPAPDTDKSVTDLYERFLRKADALMYEEKKKHKDEHA